MTWPHLAVCMVWVLKLPLISYTLGISARIRLAVNSLIISNLCLNRFGSIPLSFVALD